MEIQLIPIPCPRALCVSYPPHFLNWPYARLFKKWAELPGALPRHRQKCSLTYPKTYARSAFLAASLHCARLTHPLFELALYGFL